MDAELHEVRRSRWIRRLALSLAAGISFSNCHSDSTAPKSPVATVAIAGTPAGGILVVGRTAQLSASTADAGGALLTGRSVTWSTSNAAVASVSPGGLVTALTGGVATITATSEAQSASTDISVGVAIPTPAAGATQPVTSTLLNGAVVVSVPPGAAAGNALFVGAAPAASVPPTTRLLAGSAFEFGPEGTPFTSPVTITLRFDPTGLTATDRAALAIYSVNAGNWDRVAQSTVSSPDNLVSAPVTHFSVYAVLKHADAASVSVGTGNNQSAPAGTAVAAPPSVTVLDSRGQTVPGVTVLFAAASGGGSVTGASQVTNNSGVATVGGWTLGAVPGPNTLTATVAGVTPVTFAATATAPPPPAIQLSSTTVAFSSIVGNVPPVAQTVSVTNSGGSPLIDLSIDAVSYAGIYTGWLSASLSSASAPSTVTLTVAPASLAAGTYSATVTLSSPSSSNSPRSIAVTLTVTPSTARQLVITTQPSGARSGVVFDVQPVLEIRDAAGVLVTSATNAVLATVAQGGTLSGTVSVTAVAGIVKFTDLMVTGRGYAQLGFESGSLTPAATPAFWVADGTSAHLVIVSGNNQTALVSTVLPQPLTVRITDIDGFPVPGVSVSWLLAADGALQSASSVTDANGVASNTWTLGATAGMQSATATVTGATGSPASFSATATAPPLDFPHQQR